MVILFRISNILVHISALYLLVLCLKTPPPKCQDCRQYLDDSDLKFFQGDPDNAVSVHSGQIAIIHNYIFCLLNIVCI